MKSCLKHVFIIINLTCFSALVHADLRISDAWVKPTVSGQPVAGAYMTCTADKNMEVVEASSPVAGKTEIHSMSMEGNIMRMKRLERLPIKAGTSLQLKPGGLHIMLIKLKQQIREGDVIPISLIAQDGHGKKTTLSIKAVAAFPEVIEPLPDIHRHH